MESRPETAPGGDDFFIGDCRVRPSRNLVELPNGAGGSPAAGDAESGGAPVAVQVEPKVMEVLVCLARRAGRVVTKDELVREVWEGRFVSDDVVWRSVRELRRALGDEARDSRFIETIPKRGYRLLAPVTELSEAAVTAPVGEHANSLGSPSLPGQAGDGGLVSPPGTGPPAVLPSAAGAAGGDLVGPGPAPAAPAAARRLPRPAVAAAALALAVAGVALALAAARWLGGRPPAGHAPPPALRLAVLPLANLSGDPAQAYFADGLTEELISRLGSLRPGRLAVVGRTSVMALAGHGGDAAEIGKKLGVAYLLEGGVRRDGERARVTVRLVRAADGTAVWSGRQDVELRQTLQAEGAIAERVARELAIELLPRRLPAAPPPPAATAATTDPRAHDAELRGRYLLARPTPAALARAADELRAAADLDPAAASPRSGLADAYHLTAVLGLAPPAAAYPRAEAAALAALERDPDSVEARTVLGSVRFRYRWDYGGAERDFQRALAVNPSYAPAHHDYAWLLVALGRMDEGIAEIREARRLEPLSPRAAGDIGWVLYRAGRADEAIAAMRSLLDLEPGSTTARDCLERALARRGRAAEALAVAREALRRDGATPEEIAALVAGTPVAGPAASAPAAGAPSLALAAGGAPADPAAARRRIAAWRLHRLTARAAAAGTYLSPYAAAAFEVEAGDAEGAFADLGRAVAGRDPMAVMLAVDPELAPLRADPRFAELVRRLGLPPAGA